MSMNVRNAPKVAVSENETERSFVNSWRAGRIAVSGLVADRLDDEREDRDGKDEGREQQVELRDRPDGHAAPDDGEGRYSASTYGGLPSPPLPLLLFRLPVPRARGVGSTIAAGAR